MVVRNMVDKSKVGRGGEYFCIFLLRRFVSVNVCGGGRFT